MIALIIMAAQRDPHLHLRKTFLKVKVNVLSRNIQTVSGILFRVRLVHAAASREFTGSMGLLLSLQSSHRKLQQFRTFEIIIYSYKMTAHSMQSLSLEWQLI